MVADVQITYWRTDRKGVSYLTTKRESTGAPTQVQEMRFVRVAVAFTMSKVMDEKRPDIHTASVVLAIPVDASGAADPQPTSQVFAFLPIRTFGFKFSIQADFILNSSREDIHTDRPWNQLLRNAISVTFGEAVEQFKKSDALAFSYLTLIPSDTEILDPFFKPVVAQIIALLSKAQCLPSASGAWKVPKELRYGGQRFRELFPPALALELFGYDYIDPRVQGGDDLLQRLGAKPSHMLTMSTSSSRMEIGSRSSTRTGKPRSTRNWLTWIRKYSSGSGWPIRLACQSSLGTSLYPRRPACSTR